jgi:hypothetical protein
MQVRHLVKENMLLVSRHPHRIPVVIHQVCTHNVGAIYLHQINAPLIAAYNQMLNINVKSQKVAATMRLFIHKPP